MKWRRKITDLPNPFKMANATVSLEAGGDVTLKMIVQDLKSQDTERKLAAVSAVRGIFCVDDPPIALMVQAGIIGPLVGALDRDDCPDFQHEALDVLTDIAFGSLEHTMAVLHSGVISKLITFLACEGDLAERAIVTLGNLALHGAEARDAVLAHGAVRAMLPHMHKNTPVRLLRTFMRTYNSLCSYNETKFEVVSSALPHINELLDIVDVEPLSIEDEKSPNIEESDSLLPKFPKWQLEHKTHIASDVVEGACTAFTNIMHGGDEYVEAVQAVPGLTVRLVALLEHKVTNVKEAALSAVGNMLGGTDAQVDRCLEANCLEHIVSLLQCSNTSLVQEAARATSNILSGTHCQIQKALDKDILTPLQDILTNGKPECQMQAARAVTCLCINGSPEQRAQLVSRGVLEPYCALLARPGVALAGEVLDGLHALMHQTAVTDKNEKPCICCRLDELDVLDQIQPLLEHITDENHRLKLVDMSVTLRKHAREERSIVHNEEVFTSEKIVRGLQSLHQATQTRAARAAYYMLREQHPPIHALLEAGIMGPLVEGLDRDACSDLQYVAVWALCKLTAGTHKHRMAVINSGTIPKLLALLIRRDKLTELAVCSLGNMAAHGPETRDALQAYTRSETALAELKTFVGSYKYLCRQVCHGPMEKLEPVLRGMPFVSELLDIGDRGIAEGACWVCAALMSNPDNYSIKAALKDIPGLVERLVALLGHEATEVQTAALAAVINVLGGTDEKCFVLWSDLSDRCLNAGCLERVVSLLQRSEPFLVATAARLMTNLLRHTHSLQRALDKDILTSLKNILDKAGEDKSRYSEVHQNIAGRMIYLLIFIGSAEQRVRIAFNDVLEPYCALLATPDHALAECVLDGLFVLLKDAKKDEKTNLCLKLDKIGVLERLLQLQQQEIDKNFHFKAVEVSANLRQLARKEHCVNKDGKAFTLSEIVQDLGSQELATQTRAARAAWKMLNLDDPPRTAMIQAGVIAPLVAALARDDCYDIQYAAAYALYVFTIGTHKHRVAVVNSGAIPKLIGLLSRRDKISEFAILALGNMARRSTVSRDIVLSKGAVLALLPLLLPNTHIDLLRLSVRAFKNFCSDIVTPCMVQLVSPALPYICKLLYLEDQIVLKAACEALSNFMFDLEERIQVVQDVPGLTARLVALFRHKEHTVQKASLCSIAFMFTGTIIQIDRCLDAGYLDHIGALFQCSEPAVVEEAARATGNMLRHENAIQRALDKGIHTLLLSILLDTEPNSHLEYNAVRSLANITDCGTCEQRLAVVDGGGIPLLVSLLEHNTAVATAAAQVLGNLARIGPEITELMLHHGAVQAMLPHLRPDILLYELHICVRAFHFICESIISTEMIEYVLPALPNIYKLLYIEDQEVLVAACTSLANIATAPEMSIGAMQAVPGLTERLVALLGHEAMDVKEIALSTLCNMLRGTETQVKRCLGAGCLDYVVSFLQFHEPSIVEVAATATKHILKHLCFCIQAMDKGILNPLLKILADAEPNSILQRYVIDALAFIVKNGTSEHRLAVVKSGVIPKLVDLLSLETVAGTVVWLMGCISEELPDTRELLLVHAAVQAMLPYMRSDTPTDLLNSCVWAYNKLSTVIITASMLELVLPALPYIYNILYIENQNVLVNVCQLLTRVMASGVHIEAVQAVPGLTARLVARIGHEATEVKLAALSAVCSMLSGTEAQIERCLGGGCLDYIVLLLCCCVQCHEPSVVELATRATVYILLHTPSCIQAMEKGILNPLLNILANAEPNSYSQQYAVFALGNIILNGRSEHKMAVINNGAIPKLVALLAHGDGIAELTAKLLVDVALKVPGTRDLVLAHGAVRAILPHMRPDTSLGLLRKCLAAYRCFCSHDADKTTEKLKFVLPALPYISELLSFEDNHVLEQACWALFELTKTSEGVEAVQAVPGLTAHLGALLRHKTTNVKNTATVVVMTALWTLYTGYRKAC